MAPTTPDTIDPPRIPTLAESSKVVRSKASVAMNSDFVKPMPPSHGAAHAPGAVSERGGFFANNYAGNWLASAALLA